MTSRHFLTYLALATMAVTQPILDLYSRNVTVFSAAKLSTPEILAFVLLVAIAPAVLASSVDRFTRQFGAKVNESARLVMLGVFSAALGLAVARWLGFEGDVGSVALSVSFAVALPWAFDRSRPVREWSRWLAVLSVAVTGSAVVQMRPVLIGTEGASTDAVVAAPSVSVIQIVFDEFPLHALISPAGTIDAERFPGFAELAASSTWYRDTVAASNFTHQAVPALLSSVEPAAEGGPFLAEYPRNIFTLFRGRVGIEGVEPVTSLCPAGECAPANRVNDSVDARRFLRFIRDAGFVYGQRVLPPTARKKLPSTEGAWGGFNAVADKFKEQFDGSALPHLKALERAVARHVRDREPRVSVVHVLAPHAPWRLTPDLRLTPQSPEIGIKNPTDDDGVRDIYQAFLHQLGATDRAVSALIAQLRDAGRWDDTMLVVSADHGISFVPGMPQRHTDFSDMAQSDDIFRVPLFVKFPNQRRGETSECAASNLDVLPTIVDVTKTATSWTFAGSSLARVCPARRERVVRSATGETAVMSEDFGAVRARAAHYAGLVPNTGPISRVAAVGASAALIGMNLPTEGTDDAVASWSIKQADGFRSIAGIKGTSVPAQVTGTVTVSRFLPSGTEGIITVDGKGAGVIGELSGASGTVRFTAILDYTLLGAGDHRVGLVIRRPDGRLTRAPG
ncbi:MAG: LTA synthase family protein [Actinobacteria bacterium]|nr:LTA synthase family protein [Actinomycetota bacterium]